MAMVIRVDTAENSGETSVTEYLRNADNLPDSYLVLTNVRVTDRDTAEIDAIVLGTPGIFALEVKDWTGKIVGRNQGDWTHHNRTERNPCRQALRNSGILRARFQHNATGMLGDPRLFHAITFLAMVVLVNPQADTSELDCTDEQFLRVCKSLDELGPRLLENSATSKRFLKNDEIRRAALALGASKEKLDAWCPKCFYTRNREGAHFCAKCGEKLGAV